MRTKYGSTQLATLTVAMLASATAFGAGQVSSILISEQPATPFSYSAGGIDYDWGRGTNQIIEGFVVNGTAYTYSAQANEVAIKRDDVPSVATGEPCGIFVELLSRSDTNRTLAADFPLDGSELGNCELSELLESRIINRGLVDAFSNVRPDAKNIERLDYLHFFGTAAPYLLETQKKAGHIVAEKSGNNPVKMAAITSLDIFGQPAAYGPMVLIGAHGCADPAICYGTTDLRHHYSFLQNAFVSPQSLPIETERSNESVSMAFVSTADLGLAPGQRYFGVSLFADDVDASIHNLVDPSTFPDDTADPNVVFGDDADIYGGLTGYFLAEDINNIQANVFFDVNGDGLPGADESGISDISATLFVDNNGNGIVDSGDVQLGDTLVSNIDGQIVFPGLADGNYIVVLDESDPEIPQGLSLAPGINPRPLAIAGGDSEPVNFSFVSDTGVLPNDPNDATDPNAPDDANDPNDAIDPNAPDGANDPNNPADPNAPDGANDPNNPADPNAPDGANDPNLPINDGVTAAAPDVFEVNQGQSGTFDVLANDFDGAGSGLTLISVSGSDNATITVTDDNQILYVPDYGYFSPENAPDTFFYTMQDGAGTQVTGNASVTVVRFSDLNSNALNDFDECNCTDLVLETGVNGSGVGHPSKWLLLLLTLTMLWRLHGKRQQRAARSGDV